MPDEVERKFRVREVPAGLGEGTRLRQAYVALDQREGAEVEVRVRDQGGRYVLGIKGGRGVRRTEVEVEIGPAEFDELWELGADRRIDKVRHRVEVGDAGDHVAEVDVYGGPLEGLVVAEVEFTDGDDAAAFAPPPWFGDEVTDDDRWSNASLATSGPPPAD